LYGSYGVSKLVNGVIGDRANPRYFMAIGLLFSALANVFFGMSSSLILLGLFWGLNGWFQGMGWPPCARLLTQWYSPNERGTKWAIWNTAHQVGGGIIMILGGFLTQRYGWRSSFFIPAAIGAVTAFWLVDRLRDSPESLGLPKIEVYRNDEVYEADARDLDQAHPVKDILFRHVLRNRQLWYLAFANFFVYLVRYGALDWAPTFLVEAKHSTVADAALKASGFEFLGIAGALLAGWLSDRYFKNRRSVVNVVYMVVLALAVAGFWLVPAGHPWVDAGLLAAIGFLVYGPQMMVGVCAADLGGKAAAATATGFTGFWGYAGSIASGVGTGWIVDRWGWDGGFAFFILAAFVGAALFTLTAAQPARASR
jgi:glycerol-3-phosphate transporter